METVGERYVSLDRIMDKVHRDNRFVDKVDYMDVVEWSGEVIKLIGAPNAFKKKVTGNSMITPNITVEDYRGPLPVDYYRVMPGGVRDYDTKIVYRGATDSFAKAPAITGEDSLLAQPDYTYTINDNYLFLSKDEATIEMAYYAFPVDDNGMPMVPDNVKYVNAISSYVAERIGFGLWSIGRLPDKVYQKLEQERLFYVGAANSAANVPSVDQAESWTKGWARLNPVINQHMTSFKYFGNQEDIYLSGGRAGVV
jgi:hypothetical protein